MFDTRTLLLAFSLTLLAGAATGIGSAIAFFARTTNSAFLAVSLGFSAGVMVYVSLTELMTQAGAAAGKWPALAAFLCGIAIAMLIDRLVPSYENPHEARGVEDMDSPQARAALMKMGLVSAIAIGIHNFPEGLATFAAALKSPSTGLAVAFAIAIHNIPEGIAVAVPIYYATRSRKKAFVYSALSGLAEPLGAVAGYLLLRPFLTDTVMGMLFASVAGIMVFISFDELLPAAHRYGEHHHAVYGLLGGMAVMAVSLALFK